MADKGGNKKKLIIIILVAVLLLSAIGFGGYYFFLRKTDDSSVTKVMNEAMFPIEEIVVNLADERGNKYLKVEIFLGYEEEDIDLLEELTKYKVKIRDSIITVLRTKKSEDIDAFGIEELKRQLKIRINSIIEKGEITDVYLNNIVVQ
ncbi:flagellar basal body-associated FliL family protein [Oceanirhabdus sp. W0125-5]|uniref:flagellar basal body-associated FliL family protein n=1 Tax=Oceanirhabdus sp. W0125-5 TaxID=2999116 RepID=UPI0022F2B16A|nr:flagellar basal body-associated FliL family protein [Oceanirhabdus sp. W0125-5]WBW95419.1 flagellar basal body-associated FliL family protein [Oceanirhabdus sp. W0125-5]